MTRGTVCRHAEAAVHLQVQCTAVCNPSRLVHHCIVFWKEEVPGNLVLTTVPAPVRVPELHCPMHMYALHWSSFYIQVNWWTIITVHCNEVAGLIAQRKVLTANLPTPQRPRYRHKAEKHFQIYNNVQFMEPFFLWDSYWKCRPGWADIKHARRWWMLQGMSLGSERVHRCHLLQ